MGDDELIGRLVGLCDDATRRDRATETVDSWAHYDRSGLVRATWASLLEDPVIGRASESGHFIFTVLDAGCGYDIRPWLAGFVREAEALSACQRRAEAQSFLRFLRVADGQVPVYVRTTLAGVQLWDGLVVDLPFGRLRSALPADFAADAAAGDLPPAAVFEYETEVPARTATTNPFTDGGGASLRRHAEAEHERAVTRILLALALTHEGPVQEHLTMRRLRYSDGGSGHNPQPLAPIVVTFPYFLAEGPRVDELRQTAELISGIRMDRLGVAVRRYLLARSERTRPTDQIVDYVTAIESLTRGGPAATHVEALAALIAANAAEATQVDAEHQRLKDARNDIIHEGKTPLDARQIAVVGRELVRRGLDASVRRELHGSQSTSTSR